MLRIMRLLCSLGLTCLTLHLSSGQEEERHIEWPPFDGWYNNYAHPNWGGAETPLLRRLPAAYSDGVYEPSGVHRPNPMEISRQVFNGSTGFPSSKNRTAFLVFFGQQVVEEVLDAQRAGCPPEYQNLKIPTGHELYDPDGEGGKEMPFLRSRYDMRTGLSPNNPRQQLNEISSYIDGTLMYGPNKAWTDGIRAFWGGRLASLNNATGVKGTFPEANTIRLPFANPPPPADHYLKPINRFYKIGNPRGNENPFLLTFGILWFRYHNLVAGEYARDHDDWSDEKIFLYARKKVVAVHQKIVTKDWIPSWLNTTLDDYSGYNPSIEPGIAHVFQSAAMRFGHTLVPPAVYRRTSAPECLFRTTSKKTQFEGKAAVRTCNQYWNPQDAVDEFDIDEFLMGMASQITEREDNIITPDLRGDVFGPLEFSRRDLMAINIQRGRDHGLPDYNTAREFYGLPRMRSFADINPGLYAQDASIFERLAALYNNSLDDIDIWPGGLLETTADGPGPLFTAVIKDQFERIRDGDRFWYENDKNGLYTADEITDIESIDLNAIIYAITNITSSDIQADPFRWLDGDPCPQPEQLAAGEDGGNTANCTAWKTFDYFTGSEWSFAVSFFALGLSLILIIGLLMLLAHMRDKTVENKRANMRRSVRKTTKDTNFTLATEWVGKKEGERSVRIKFDKTKKYILVQTSSGKPLRTIDLSILASSTSGADNKTVDVIISADRNLRMLLIRVPKEYDLVLKCDSVQDRQQILQHLEEYLAALGLGRNLMTLSENEMKQTCETYALRKEKLTKFFLHAMTMVLLFDQVNDRETFLNEFTRFISEDVGIGRNAPRTQSEGSIKDEAYTKEERNKLLNVFFREIMSKAFKDEGEERSSGRSTYRESRASRKSYNNDDRNILECELTKVEFADALSMKPNSLFVESMYDLVDADKNGYISFREFLDMIIIFSKGDADRKAKLLFDMYDLDGSGELSRAEFKIMLKSLIELANDKIEEDKITDLVDKMFKSAGLQGEQITLADFQNLLKDYKSELNYISLDLKGTGVDMPKKRENAPNRARRTIYKRYASVTDDARNKRLSTSPLVAQGDVKTIQARQQPQGALAKKWNSAIKYIENYRQHIFWCTLYTLVAIGIFVERAYYYSVEREHAGLRRIAGYGVTVTRGAASGMMFTYSCLLVTMCRNLITFLRETFLHRYIPFDAAIAMHKYIAFLALGFTLMHIIGHSINFYHISTQTANDLICLFRNFFHATDVLPKFHRWCWGTLTGFTGVLLTINMFVIYVFAMQYARRHVFRAFWITHNTYVIFFMLTILHGAGRLVQPAFFHYFFLGPCILFTFDKLITLSRNKVEIAVIKAELLPSDVTMLEFRKPHNFEYKSGQWVRIASLLQGESEYHPFTLSSAPHEENLTLHIRAVGPWTMNLRNTYDPANVGQHALPKIYLDGPYGEGHQDWYKFEVAVLVGGGIGVTPFASILKDIAHRSSTGQTILCKKVYFLWVTRTQRHFEWLVDMIKEVEEKDTHNLVSVHIFITQFKQKFDIRTTMLYICEKYFQKISERSLFTGLRSITHFGRPDFESFLKMLEIEHADTSVFGVFSCGPPPMTLNVENACSNVNKYTQNVLFVHHYENF